MVGASSSDDKISNLDLENDFVSNDISVNNYLMQFLMGLNDVFQPIRSSLLARETLPDVKNAFAIISREESHRGIASSSSSSVTKPQENGAVYKFLTISLGASNSQTIGNSSAVCFVSKSMWHTRLGHTSLTKFDMLQQEPISPSDSMFVSPCDIAVTHDYANKAQFTFSDLL
ncbi:hypothetical protein Tco_0788924 [Tanacetum coccineum]